MRRILVLAAAALSACVSVQQGDGPGGRDDRALRCPHLAGLAPTMFAAGPGDRAAYQLGLDEQHARIRGPRHRFEAPDARIVLKALAGGTHTQSVRTSTSAIVWLDSAGVWRVDRVDFAEIAPPPPAPGTDPALDEDPRRERLLGVLSSDRASIIETALADPCFELEPDFTGPHLEMRAGVRPEAPCYSGMQGSLEVVRGGQARPMWLFCPRWRAGEIHQAVLYARPSD